MELTGTLNDYATISDKTTFDIHMIKIIGSVTDKVYKVGNPGISEAITPVTYSPNGGSIPAYTFSYSLFMADGTTAPPSWITIDGSNNIVIA